jgi:uncharacterized repeat protein (TIGR04138 family)
VRQPRPRLAPARDAPAAAQDAGAGRTARRTGKKAPAAIKGSEYPVEAFSFILGALRYAYLRKTGGAGGRASVDAREVCDAVRYYGRLRLHGEANAVRRLAEWKIRRSEDVGRIIFRMVEAGRLHASPGDSPGQFAGLFTLETLFEKPPS